MLTRRKSPDPIRRATLSAIAVALGLGALACDSPAKLTFAEAQEAAPSAVFRGIGIVKAIDPATGALTLDHDDIKGLMSAMTMMYNVASPGLRQGLRVGDRIAFEIDARGYIIVGVTLLQHAR
jgi:Cu/Ag efflux protein CusF